MSIEKAVELIKNSKKIFALTGAGISTESGIPDFRSETGYYSKMDPMAALSKDVLLKNPKRFYSEGYVILSDLNDKSPNQGHIALKELEDLGYLQGIITQNIDNLHTKAGSSNVYEVHGETRDVRCMSCGKVYPFSYMKEQVEKNIIPPKCQCGGVIRPNVVMFGDMMPDDFTRAAQDLEDADLLIVIGSSLQVSPVNYLPRYVKNLIIINNEPTPFDSYAQVVIHEPAGKTLKKIIEALK